MTLNQIDGEHFSAIAASSNDTIKGYGGNDQLQGGGDDLIQNSEIVGNKGSIHCF